MNSRITKLVGFVLITRVLLYILPWIFSIIITPEKTPLPFITFLTSWNHWDAPHYLYLSQHGYTNIGDEANFIVFLPLYPILINIFNFILGNSLITAMVLSNFFFVLSSIVLYKLMLLDYHHKVASRAVILLAIFPTAYFFSAPYTESLFFFLATSAFYFARKENFLAAGAVAGLASFTRPFGFLIIIAILFELVLTKISKKTAFQVLTAIVPTAFFITLYLLLNQIIYNSPFAFQKILHDNWQKSFGNPITSIISSWRLALTSGLSHNTLMVGWAEAITSTVSLILIPFAFKYLRRSWAVYYTLSIIFFTSTSFILSSPRYLLSLPPFFILLAVISKRGAFALKFTFIALLFLLTVIYTSGQWAF